MASKPASIKIGNLAVVPLAIIAFMQMNGGDLAALLDLKTYYLEAVLSAIGLLVALVFGLFIKDPAIRKQTLLAGAGVTALGILTGFISYWMPDFNLL